LNKLTETSKKEIIEDIEADFKMAYEGILRLPIEAKFGVYTAYRYYKRLLTRLKTTPSTEIKNARIRVPDYQKVELLARCYVKYRLNLL
jgi:transposase